MKKNILYFLALSIFVTSCTFENATPLPVGCNATIYYGTDILPIMNANCVSCHSAGGTGSGPGDYTLYSDIKAADMKIKNRIFDKNSPMPPAGSTPLTSDQLSKLNCWIGQGAPNN